MLVLTSRYGEETALRALWYFASFAFNVSLFLERIPCAKLAKDRKARRVGWFLRRAARTGLSWLRQFLKTRARYRSVRNITRNGSARIEAVASAWAISFDPIIGHRLTRISIAASVSSASAEPAKR